jgi:DNA polymerase III epsilon subunit-like protein
VTASLPAALTGQQLAVVDVEGNGQQPPEIIEIAVLPVDGEVSGEHLRLWLIRPERPINPMVTRKVHGISNEDVAHCPPWSAVATEVEPLLTERTLVAHNASVELNVLTAHLPAWKPPMVLDTLRLAKHVLPNLSGGYGLDNVVRVGRAGHQRHQRAALPPRWLRHLVRLEAPAQLDRTRQARLGQVDQVGDTPRFRSIQ